MRVLEQKVDAGRPGWALVAVLLCAYTIAKVLRDALFLAEFGALALPYAYLGVAVASVGFVWVESRVAGRFQRVGAGRFHLYLAITCSIAAALVFPHAPRVTTALFYVWTGSQAMMLLPHFWDLALDIWDSRRARLLFPLLAGSGLIDRESAEMALERALQALACWYDPRPLEGVFDRLKSRDREIVSPALEFLEHVLPRALFRPVRQIFEEAPVPPETQGEASDPLAVWIEGAWKSDDEWLRACAVRASRFLTKFDRSLFVGDTDAPMVREELATWVQKPC